MSISSDIYVSREKAEKMVKRTLLYQQELLIDSAIKGMDDSDLAHYLHTDTEYFNVESSDEE